MFSSEMSYQIGSIKCSPASTALENSRVTDAASVLLTHLHPSATYAQFTIASMQYLRLGHP